MASFTHVSEGCGEDDSQTRKCRMYLHKTIQMCTGVVCMGTSTFGIKLGFVIYGCLYCDTYSQTVYYYRIMPLLCRPIPWHGLLHDDAITLQAHSMAWFFQTKKTNYAHTQHQLSLQTSKKCCPVSLNVITSSLYYRVILTYLLQ